VAWRAGAAIAALRAGEAEAGVIPGEVGHEWTVVSSQRSEIRLSAVGGQSSLLRYYRITGSLLGGCVG
jgi:hypothetical protein